MTPETLLSLADRVCAGDGPDTHLSYAIGKAIQPVGDPPDLLTSIDATELLRARMLPGSFIDVQQMSEEYSATLWPNSQAIDDDWLNAHATTEPRARLAAILRALAAGG